MAFDILYVWTISGL